MRKLGAKEYGDMGRKWTCLEIHAMSSPATEKTAIVIPSIIASSTEQWQFQLFQQAYYVPRMIYSRIGMFQTW